MNQWFMCRMEHDSSGVDFRIVGRNGFMAENQQDQNGQRDVKLVVCLGNPGDNYALTRHNAGWQTAEMLKARGLVTGPAGLHLENGSLQILETPKNHRVFLLKPMTYMNASGAAVKEMADKTGIAPPEMLVICDCMDLGIGKLRLRRQGSSGGQRGVDSIIQYLQTQEFPRLRIGIGRPEPGMDVVDHVLSDWVSADNELVKSVLSAAADCVISYIDDGYETACRMASEVSADKFNAKLKGDTEIGKV